MALVHISVIHPNKPGRNYQHYDGKYIIVDQNHPKHVKEQRGVDVACSHKGARSA